MGTRYLLLAGEDLPDSDLSLKDAEGVRAHAHRHVIQPLYNFHEQLYRVVRKFRKFSKDAVLVAVVLEVASQQANGSRRKVPIRRAPAVEFS